MLRFLLRRLIQLFITLLGVTLVTLGLIQLVPGGPEAELEEAARAAGGLTPEQRLNLRRTFYLDLPLILNLAPQDARDADQRLLEALISQHGRTRRQAVWDVGARGLLALPTLVHHLGAPLPLREAILTGLAQCAARAGLDTALQAAPSPEVFWRDVARDLPADPDLEARRLVDALVGGDTSVLPALRRLDTFALPALLEALDSHGDDAPSLPAITAELSRLTGQSLFARPSDSLELKARVRYDWHRWWGPRRADYVVLSPFQRFTAAFTETQYARWIKRLVTFDFDRSSRDQRPIRQKLRERLKVTMTLALCSLVVVWLLSVPLGVFSAIKRGSLVDRVLTVVLFGLYSLPGFWVAVLLQRGLCGVEPGGLNILPLAYLHSSNFQALSPGQQLLDLAWHLVLPVLVMAYPGLAWLSRFQRGAMLEVIRQDYIRTARAKGLAWRTVLFKHALRNAMLPMATVLGMQMRNLVGGSVIVESIFQIEGMGLETMVAIQGRDINWIMASVTVMTLVAVAGLLLSDVLYAVLDPRLEPGSDAQR